MVVTGKMDGARQHLKGFEIRKSRDVELCKETGNWWMSKRMRGETDNEVDEAIMQADIYMKHADCSIEFIRQRLATNPWLVSDSLRPIRKKQVTI